MKKETAKAVRTRAHIIEKTAPIFNKKGFAGTSLQDMTAATRLSKGSIYANFANKDEVALAVFDYNFRKLRYIIQTGMEREASVTKKLLVYASVYDQFLKHPFLSTGCPIQNTATEADDTHPKLRQKALDAVLSWRNSIVKLLRKGIQSKELKPDIQPTQVAFTLIALIEGGIMISKLTGRRTDQHAIRLALEELIAGLRLKRKPNL